MQHARPKAIMEAPRQASLTGLMVGLALISTSYYLWDMGDVLGEPTQNVDLDAYTEHFGAVDKLLDYLESLHVQPHDEESLTAWRRECESVIWHSGLPAMLKWSLWAQATNSNVWLKEDMRELFEASVVKSYVKRDKSQRIRILVGGSEELVARIYQLRLAQLRRAFTRGSIRAEMTTPAFSELFKEVYGRAHAAAAVEGRPDINEFSRAIVATPQGTTEASRHAMYDVFQDLDRFLDDTEEISRMTKKPIDVNELIY